MISLSIFPPTQNSGPLNQSAYPTKYHSQHILSIFPPTNIPLFQNHSKRPPDSIFIDYRSK